MKKHRISAYHTMWVFVLFDLPTGTKQERKAAAKFRKSLLTNGFNMFQYSVYVRHCFSPQAAEVHKKRVEKLLPDKGRVSAIAITDKQFGNIRNFYGQRKRKPPQAPLPQLEMFLDEPEE